MVGDKPRYELHFHGLVQDAVVGDYNKVTQIFQAILSQPTARPLHQLPPDIADFIALSGWNWGDRLSLHKKIKPRQHGAAGFVTQELRLSLTYHYAQRGTFYLSNGRGSCKD